METLSPTLVSTFLEMFAPLQLLVDRAKHRKISMHRKILGTCSALSVAHSLVKRASDVPGPSSNTDKLANLLCLNKRIALPHPSWTSRQDAVLIKAIVKHGWIDQDSCCRAITADSSIKWGLPFDDGGSGQKETRDNAKNEPDLKRLRETARQAAEFLNTEQDVVDEVKGFNTAILVKSYGLVQSTEETGLSLSTSKWMVDDNLLLQNLTGQATKEGTDKTSDDTEVEVDLPTKKELLKRAKTVLSRAAVTSEQPLLAAAAAVAMDPQPAHDFSALDQTNPCNMLLAEMLRALLKLSFIKSSQAKKTAKYLCSNAQAEARRLCEGIKNLSGENDSEVNELQKIAGHIRLVGRTMTSSPRQAKNVLRAILGDPPILPKNNPLEPVFPFIGTMELQITTVDVAAAGGSSNNGESAPSIGTKKGSFTGRKKSNTTKSSEGAAGDRAISRAIAKGGEKNKEVHGKFSESLDPSSLGLTASETLILSILCAQGLPVWSETHAIELISNYEDSGPDMHAGLDNVITWRLAAELVMAGAEGWAQQAAARLERARAMTITEKRLADIRDLEREEEAKRLTFAIAKDDVANPLKFAKKCIMLLEAVRLHMGPVDAKRGSTPKQMKIVNRSENGLGPKVIFWLGTEIGRWAQSLNIVDRAQRPYSSTAASTARDGEKGITLFAIMSKQNCRAVFAQVAQLTRSRSIFISKSESEMRELVERAVKQSRSAEDVWEDKPAWWNSCADSTHDYDLLDGLLYHGYHYSHHIFSNVDSFAQGKEVRGTRVCHGILIVCCSHLFQNYQRQAGAEDDDEREVHLSKKAIQLRVNQITRELHAQEESIEALRMLDKRKSRLSGGLGSVLMSTAQERAEKTTAAASHHAVQTGIKAFFSSTKPAASDSKERENELLDLGSDSDVEVVEEPKEQRAIKVVEPPKQKAVESDGSEVEIVPPPNEEAFGKRKECPSNAESEAGSPEKKTKIA